MKIQGMVQKETLDVELELENKGSDAVKQVLKPLGEAERAVLEQMMDGTGGERIASVGVIRGSTACGDEKGTTRSGATMLLPLQRAGISTATLSNTLKEGLNARKHVVVSGRVKRVPDHAVRLKFLELAHKLRGDYPAAAAAAEQHETYEARIMTVMNRVQSKMTKAIASVEKDIADTVNDR